MSPQKFLIEARDALDHYRFADLTTLIHSIDPATFTVGQAEQALGMIRRKRRFADLERAAGLFYLGGKKAPQIRRQYAQALLDQNRIAAAMSALHELLPMVEDDAAEGPEVRGLIGRAHKQRFINHKDRAALPRAIAAYYKDWEASSGSHRWHGINLVALLKRAERDGVDPGVIADADAIARRIRADIEGLAIPDYWDCGTAMEASVALGDVDGALKWARVYAMHEKVDAFELGSTLRQLREVWQLQGTPTGDSLLPVLEYELLQREGGTLTPKGGKADLMGMGFEAVYGQEGGVRLQWMESMLKYCCAIGRVFDPEDGKPWGTGFLARGKDLRPDWGDRLLFVTNSHVVSNNPADEAKLAPGDAKAEFTRLKGSPKIGLGELVFTSPRSDLDVSVLELERPIEEVEPLKVTQHAPAVPDGDEVQRIYIIGHPNGRDLEVSLYDNNLAGYDGPYVRYHSPTEGGNSGSPVFNRRWRTFAIHHRARASLGLNEGVLLEHIAKAASSESP